MSKLHVTSCAIALCLAAACRPTAPPVSPDGDAPPVAVTPTTPAPAPEVLHLGGSVVIPGGGELAFAVELTPGANGYTGKIQIPSQGARDVPLSDVVVTADAIAFAIAGVGAKWSATRDAEGDPDVCSFEQGGAKLECGMARIDAAAYAAVTTPKRPQVPKPPFDYDIVEVAYENTAGKGKIAGTLTVPKGDGPHPAVLMVTGSGAQDRDETIFDHKPFWVIADHLARHGIATLRVDDRGVGGSTGDPKTSTTEDFIGDAVAGVAFLATQPRIDPKRVGIIGHSEGGLIGPAAAVRSKQVAFVVMLAGPGVSGAELMPRQVERVLLASKVARADVDKAVAQQRDIVNIVAKETDPAVARKRIEEVIRRDPTVQAEDLGPEIDQLLSPWFRNFVAYDPQPVLRKVSVPVLALVGDLDVQVDAEQNATAIAKALRKKGNGTEVRRLPGLNHLFQHATTGAVAEYGTIEETVAPEVLDQLSTWIAARKPKK